MKSDCRDLSISATAAASSGASARSGSRSEQTGGGGARGHDRVLVAQHPQGRQAGAETRLRAAEDVALAALAEVETAELEAVGRRGHGVEPLAGGRADRGVVTSRHSPGRPPRPTRPRSWWSWEMPNRSASSSTMMVALATSTPTSMTVVDDEHVDLAGGEARASPRSLSSGAIWPCSISIRRPASGPCARRLLDHLGDRASGCSSRWTRRRLVAGRRRARQVAASSASSSPSSSSSPVIRGHTT